MRFHSARQEAKRELLKRRWGNVECVFGFPPHFLRSDMWDQAAGKCRADQLIGLHSDILASSGLGGLN